MEILNLLKEGLINNLGEIIFGLATTIFGFFTAIAKKMADEFLANKEKREIVKTVVMAVEQMSPNLTGAEKLKKAMDSASEMLLEKGIKITELELLMLIEATICEFNDSFNKKSWKDGLDEANSSGESILDGDTYSKTETEPDEEVTAETYG